jgi:hypothetical protein
MRRSCSAFSRRASLTQALILSARPESTAVWATMRSSASTEADNLRLPFIRTYYSTANFVAATDAGRVKPHMICRAGEPGHAELLWRGPGGGVPFRETTNIDGNGRYQPDSDPRPNTAHIRSSGTPLSVP